MDTNMTFRIDSQTKARMTEICNQLGMTPSTAFNIFANAFVRANDDTEADAGRYGRYFGGLCAGL